MFLVPKHECFYKVRFHPILITGVLFGALAYAGDANVSLKLVRRNGKPDSACTIESFKAKTGREFTNAFKKLRAKGIPYGTYDLVTKTADGRKYSGFGVAHPETFIVVDCEPELRVERSGSREIRGKIRGLESQAGYWVRVVQLFESRGVTEAAEVNSDGTFKVYDLENGRHLAILLKDEKIIQMTEFVIALGRIDMSIDLIGSKTLGQVGQTLEKKK